MRTRRDTRARRRGPAVDFSRPSSGGAGGARLGMKLSIEGWMRKSKRLRAVVEALPVIKLSWAGNHSVLNQSNANIAKHAIANGDMIWTLTPGTLQSAAAEVRNGLVGVARREQRDVSAEMDEAKDIIYEDVKFNIADGHIDGPARTAEWNAYKAQKWGPATPNMVASGEWLASLTAELVER